MVNLYTFFKDSSLRTGVLENVQIAMDIKVFKLICPSATRWLSHGRCFSRVVKRYPQIVISLATIWEDRGDAAAYGILLLMLKPEMILTCMMLSDVLGIMNILVLWLQKSPSTVDVTDLHSIIEMVGKKIRALTTSNKEKPKDFSNKEEVKIIFSEENFNKLSEDVEAVSLPRVPMMIRRSAESKSQTFSSFKDSTHDPFCNDIANEIEEKIQPSPISAAFRCLDLRLFPQDRNKLNNHGLDDLERLKDFYGHGRSSIHPLSGKQCCADPIIDIISTSAEYDTYKTSFGVSYTERYRDS